MDLSYNKIGPVGATELAEALKVNTSIRSLNLMQNEIEEEGATAFAEAFRVNSTVTEFLFVDENLENKYFYMEIVGDNRLSNEIISRLSDIFLLVMIPRVLSEYTDAFYQHLSDMKESTLKQNLAKRFFVLQKENQTQSQILLPGKFSRIPGPLNKDKQVQTWKKGSIKEKSELQAKQIYDRIHSKEKDKTAVMLMMKSDSQARKIYDQIYNNKNKYFTFDVNKREIVTVNKKEQEIWYKFNEYLSMTKQQLSLDTYVPRKLLLELFELYVDNGIIEFSTEYFGPKKKDYSEKVLRNKVLRKLNRVVAFQYINILRNKLPSAEIDELTKKLIQEQQSSKQKIQKQTSTSISTTAQTQKQTQRPYYKKLEKKIFQLHYEKIINTIIQSNQKKLLIF